MLALSHTVSAEQGSSFVERVVSWLPFAWFRKFFWRWHGHWNREKAQTAIEEAYDNVPAALYKKMLDDPWMQYTSAMYSKADTDLESAQVRKMERLLELSGLNSKEPATILDIGCGWGGLLHYATLTRKQWTGVGITNSKKMFEATNNRAVELKLPFGAKLCDFRDIEIGKQVDAVFAVEMIEAIGLELYGDFARVVKSVLKPKGRAVLQVINSTLPVVPRERRPHESYVLTYIFPGSQIPRNADVIEAMTNAGMRLVEEHSFGLDYARTLFEWRKRVKNEENGRLRRRFEYYLAWCEAGFTRGFLSVTQLVFEK